ncbi:MAG: UDP-N-acetylmuramoyl-L-alanyl-D-glutamate--2,6-diaminopimelate ligase [Oleiphilaceae bacterium]|nr:UDP-N-acetylmuramoyl-L-alanyl-D-glutamate--2,6-diaminopimelate ligase [Oleiphilaceae bacterium]
MNKARQYHSDLASLLLGIQHVPSALNTQIHGLVSDSRKVKQGDLFLALPGINSPASTYVQDAIERGAAAVLIDCNANEANDLTVHEDGRAIELFVPNLSNFVGEIAHRFFHKPSEELQVIGVTGTNGKTSVVNYIAQFFASLGVSSAVIGTLGYGLCARDEELTDTGHTTPSVVDVHKYLANLRDAGAELVAMEVSSHGLDQGRVDGVRFEGAVFTNLSRDHLDYHQTMAEYAKAKARLFASEGLRYAVINADDEYASVMFQALRPEVRKLRFSLNGSAEVLVKDFQLGMTTTAKIEVADKIIDLNSDLLGQFNLYNVMAVLGVALAKLCSVIELNAINQLKAVKGRMELHRVTDKPALVVDYAHTPDALENVLQTIRNLEPKRIHVVFGCGGDRDQGKRAQMGLIAKEFADVCVITSDNPRTEDPEQIISQIASVFSDQDDVVCIADRAQAISHAYHSASVDDVVLIAGKGHEDYQEVNGVRSYFSDSDCCDHLLAEEVQK